MELLHHVQASDMFLLWDEARGCWRSRRRQTVGAALLHQGVRIIRWVNDLDYRGMRLSAIFQEDKA